MYVDSLIGRLRFHLSIRRPSAIAALMPRFGFPFSEHCRIRFFIFFLPELVFGIFLRRLHGRRYAAVLRQALRTFKLSPHYYHRSRRIASYTAAKITTSAPDILVLFCSGQIHWLFSSFFLILNSLLQASCKRARCDFKHPPAAVLVKRQTKYRKSRTKLCQ